MAEEDEIDDKTQHEQYDYSYIDPLTSIGFKVESDSIYYIYPPKELSTYPMYLENPEKHGKNVIFVNWNNNQ